MAKNSAGKRSASKGRAASRGGGGGGSAAPESGPGSTYRSENGHEVVRRGVSDNQISDDALADEVREVYREATGGELGVRVYLSDVRDAFPNISKGKMDRALLNLVTRERRGASLYKLDNPLAITPRRRSGTFTTPVGDPRHIIYFSQRD